MYSLVSIVYCILFFSCLTGQASLHTNNNNTDEIDTFDLISSWAEKELQKKKLLTDRKAIKPALAPKQTLTKKEKTKVHKDVSMLKEVFNNLDTSCHIVNQMYCMVNILKKLSSCVKSNLADKQHIFFQQNPDFFKNFFDKDILAQVSHQMDLKKIIQRIIVNTLEHYCPPGDDITGFNNLLISFEPLGSFILVLHEHKKSKSNYVLPQDLAKEFNQISYSFKPWNSIASLYQPINELLQKYETTGQGNNIVCKHLRCFAECLSLAPHYIISKNRAINLFAGELENIVGWHSIPCTKILFLDEKTVQKRNLSLTHLAKKNIIP